jgi:uncharacterized membrane protein YfcA
MVAGFAVKDAVGAAAGGGGGGGGAGATFLLQAVIVSSPARAKTANHFMLLCFNSTSLRETSR